MLGGGYSINHFNLSGHIGVVDTMTINDSQVTSTYDPFTGQMSIKGVQHSNDFGYLISVSYRYFLKEVTRNTRGGWSLSPSLSYTDTFGSSPYRGYFSAGLSIDLWID